MEQGPGPTRVKAWALGRWWARRFPLPHLRLEQGRNTQNEKLVSSVLGRGRTAGTTDCPEVTFCQWRWPRQAGILCIDGEYKRGPVCKFLEESFTSVLLLCVPMYLVCMCDHGGSM